MPSVLIATIVIVCFYRENRCIFYIEFADRVYPKKMNLLIVFIIKTNPPTPPHHQFDITVFFIAFISKKILIKLGSPHSHPAIFHINLSFFDFVKKQRGPQIV